MIKPYKYMDINTSVLSIAAIILKKLIDVGSLSYDSLLDSVKDELGSNIKYNYIYALNLLFLLGKISYQKGEDIVELVK